MRHSILESAVSLALVAMLTPLAVLTSRSSLAADLPGIGSHELIVAARADQTALYAPASANCTSRPRINVATTVEQGRLRVVVRVATSPAIPVNALELLRFAAPSNAQIILNDQTVFVTSRDVRPPAGTTTYTFFVERIAEGNATAPFVAVDACGDWSTFVGGGVSVLPIAPARPPTTRIEGVPVCTDHDATRWHQLVKRNASGAIICTYGHEHHADPNAVNDIFGPPSAWFGGTQAISYPWQTFSAAGMENHVKHEGYKWYVQRNVPCKPFGGMPGCIVAWRVQVHSLGTASDAVTRFHSFSLEAVVELNGKRGIVRHGGWIDTGHLALLADGGAVSLCPGLLTDPPSFSCLDSPKREHSGVNVPAPHSDHSGQMVNWYSQHQVSQVTPRLEEWGPIDYQQPATQRFHPSAVRGNNSRGRIENMAVVTLYSWFQSYTGADGLVRYHGYTLRDGTPVGGCATPSVDCVPLAIDAPSGIYGYNAVQAGLTNDPEFDILSPVTGNSLIRFPN